MQGKRGLARGFRVGAGFYTTVNEDYEKSAQAKSVVDNFNENVNLDALLCDMARMLIACGNDFWLKLTHKTLRRCIGCRLMRLNASSRAILKTEP